MEVDTDTEAGAGDIVENIFNAATRNSHHEEDTQPVPVVPGRIFSTGAGGDVTPGPSSSVVDAVPFQSTSSGFQYGPQPPPASASSSSTSVAVSGPVAVASSSNASPSLPIGFNLFVASPAAPQASPMDVLPAPASANNVIVQHLQQEVELGDSNEQETPPPSQQPPQPRRLQQIQLLPQPGRPDDHGWQESRLLLTERASFLLNNERMSDIKFVVGEQKVVMYGHKLILAMGSPVFEAQFFGCLKSNDEVIELPDFEPQTFLLFLKVSKY